MNMRKIFVKGKFYRKGCRVEKSADWACVKPVCEFTSNWSTGPRLGGQEGMPTMTREWTREFKEHKWLKN